MPSRDVTNDNHCTGSKENLKLPSMGQLPSCNFRHMWFLFRVMLAELIGTATICFVVVLYKSNIMNSISEPVVVFFLFAWIAWVFGPISGPQINPAISIALMLTRRITIVHAFVSIAAQCIGAVLGAFIGRALLPDNLIMAKNIGQVVRNPDLSVGKCLGLEIIGGIILLLTILASVDEFRDLKWSKGEWTVFPFMLGIVHALLATVLTNLSGAGLNPARCFGTSVINNNYDDLWIYVLGPIVGSLLATIIYELFLSNATSINRLKSCFVDRQFDCSYDYRS